MPVCGKKILIPLVGEGYALPISGITLSGLIFTLSLIFIPKLGRGSSNTYRLMGLLWVVLTLVFETSLSVFAGKTFNEILKAYDVTTGNLWLLVVVFIGFTPGLVSQIKHLVE